MNTTELRKLLRGNGGIAMTETALLCFFLYVPVLMMVIIWGDMTLDKTRAHIASAYIAFSGREPDEEQVRDIFFPGAGAVGDGMNTVREADIELARLTSGPRYELPSYPSGDYSGEPPGHDLQFRLYSMALGRMWITTHVDASGGDVGFEYRVHQLRNEMARYLSRENIVEAGELPDDLPPIRPGETLQWDTGTESRAYSGYVEILTAMFNDALTGGRMPRGEVSAVLRTRFRSPFFRELEREYDSPRWRGGVIGGGLPGTLDMQFGPRDAEGRRPPWRDDDDFLSGYAYLRNPAAHPDGGSLLDDIAAIGIDGVLPETREMFRTTVDGQDVNPGAMWRLQSVSSHAGPDHQRFLQPRDPRERQ